MATVYVALDDAGEPLYVGRSRSVGRRMEEHFSDSGWWRSAGALELIHVSGDDVARKLEEFLIEELKPPFNRETPRLTYRGRELLERILGAKNPVDVEGVPWRGCEDEEDSFG